MRTLAAAIALTSLLLPAWGQEKPVTFQFQMGIVAKMTGGPFKMDADTRIDYRFDKRPGEVLVRFDSFAVKVFQDGKEMVVSEMSKDRFMFKKDGQVQEIKAADAPAQLKQMLQDGFGAPLCKLEIDATGKELKRTMVAGPGAKDFVDKGVIANTRLFHPAFPPNQDKWVSMAEIGTGQLAPAKGELTYEKLKPADKMGRVPVKVSGTIAGAADTGKFKYVIQGEQTYDTKLQEWVSGAYTAEVTMDFLQGKEKQSGTGTMQVTMRMTTPKP